MGIGMQKAVRLMMMSLILLSACADQMPDPVSRLIGKAERIFLNGRGKWEADFGDGLIMVFLPAGSFLMGSASGEADEKPAHPVQLNSFWIGKYEITQGLWNGVMRSESSNFRGNEYPVDLVSWKNVQEFVSRLNNRSGLRFRLPTEAEWEFSCRAGTSGDRVTNLNAEAWFFENSESSIHPVGIKQSNPWGLHDMLGNVQEWCQDWYGESYYSSSPTDNPPGPSSGSAHVIRGGSWIIGAGLVRPTRRNYRGLYRINDQGFRLVLASE